MAPTLVLFDVDGTLLETKGAGRRALERAFRDVFGIDDATPLGAGVRYSGRTDPRIVADVAREAGIPGDEIERRFGELVRAYLVELRRELADPALVGRVLPGVRTVLDRLRARSHVSLGLVTGNLEDGARAKLGRFDLNGYFSDGGFSSDHPDRDEIARIAHERFCRRTGFRFPPDSVTIVGDTELDVACARANGFRAVAVCGDAAGRAEVEAAGPDVLLSGFDDLTAVMRALRL